MKLWVIKLGQATLSNPEAVKTVGETLRLLGQQNIRSVLVVGKDPELDVANLLNDMGINSVSMNGNTGLDAPLVSQSLEMNLTPVMSFSTDADMAASTLALDLGARVLVFATGERGILDLNGLPYDSLTLSQLQILMDKEGVTGGMYSKSKSIEYALTHGVNKVCVTHVLEMKELVEPKISGTLCVPMGRLDTVMKMKENYYAVS